VDDIGEVAVLNSAIVGTADGGKRFFIFDTNSVTDESPQPIAQVFSDRQAWANALKSAGITEIPKLNKPSELARGVPDRILHPQDYRIMGGLFRWPDYTWADNIGSLLILSMFLLCLLSESPHLAIFAIVLGIATDFFCQMLFGDGPGFLPGVVAYPLMFTIIGLFARLLRYLGRRLFVRRSSVSA
jgi:hypothetical protein